jgi:integrase/recombinase XerC
VHAADESPGTARKLLEEYLTHLAQERRLSAHTVRNYRHGCTLLLELNPALDALSPHAVRRAIAQLHGRGLSGRTLAAVLSAWRGWFQWLARHRGFKTNPCAGIRAPKARKLLPKALTPDQAAQLLAPLAEEPADGPAAIRDQAMFELLYSSGLRLAELIALDAAQARDIAAQGEVTVTGKGRRTRTVPVGSKAIGALNAWMSVRASCARIDEPALFVGARGARIGARMVQARLARWGLAHGLPVRVHPHVLRHSFASHVLQSSGDLRAVQEMLGHASISTTQVYTHLDFQHLAKAYDAAHPRAKRKSKTG